MIMNLESLSTPWSYKSTEIDYTFHLTPSTSRDFGNIYNDKYMNFHQLYSTVIIKL